MNRTALAGADLFAWMALRRVHRGYVAKLDDRYFDAGRTIPGYLAEALDALAKAELVVLAEADPLAGGLRRATMTDSGKARFMALHEHTRSGTQPRVRWAFSPLDCHGHALRDDDQDPAGALVARCGHCLPSSSEPEASPTAHRAVCTDCIAIVVGPPRVGIT